MRHDARQNRARILAAAEEVFGEHGAAGSTEEVARRAGVGIGTVFRHFPTKGALIEAALLAHFATLREQAAAAAGHPDPGAALRDLIRTMVDTGPAKVQMIDLVRGAGPPPPAVLAASTELKAAFDVVLRRAQAAGAVRGSVTVAEVYLLISALSQTTAALPTPVDTVYRAVDVVLAGLSAH